MFSESRARGQRIQETQRCFKKESVWNRKGPYPQSENSDESFSKMNGFKSEKITQKVEQKDSKMGNRRGNARKQGLSPETPGSQALQKVKGRATLLFFKYKKSPQNYRPQIMCDELTPHYYELLEDQDKEKF